MTIEYYYLIECPNCTPATNAQTKISTKLINFIVWIFSNYRVAFYFFSKFNF